MQFQFIKIPSNGRGNANEKLNKLLLGARIASVGKEFVSTGEVSFWAFCAPKRHPDEFKQQHRVPDCPQLRLPGPDGHRLSKGLNRPPSSSCRYRQDEKTQDMPSGTARPAEAGAKSKDGSAAPHGPQVF
jgi:hypothetical protein